METQENMIDVKAIFNALLKKWYWFVIGVIISTGLGVLYYLSTPYKYMVDGQVLVRSGEDAVSLPGADMLQLIGIGGTKKIDDEIAMMTSRDIFKQVIRELDLQTTYSVKNGLRWKKQYRSSRDFCLEFPPIFLDTTRTGMDIRIKVRKDDYCVKIKTSLFHTQRYVVTSFDEPFQTEVGWVRIRLFRPLREGSEYHTVTRPILSLVKHYTNEMTVSKLKKESSIIRLSTITDQPGLAIDFMNKQIELYNMEAVIDKKIQSNATALFIGERMDLIARELELSEVEIEQYKKDNRITNVEADMEIYLRENAEYRHQIEVLETQIKLIDFVESFVKDDKNKNQLIPSNIGIEDEGLTQLIAQYDEMVLRRMKMDRTATSENPVILQLDDQLTIMRANILTSMQSVKQSLKISKQDMEELNRKSNNTLLDIPSKEREYLVKFRNMEMLQKIYLYLYEKREENAFSLVAAVPPANVVVKPQFDPAAVSPRLRYIALLALFLGCGIPVAIIYLMYLFNDKITDRKQFEKLIKCPYAGELINYPEGDAIVVGNGVDSTAAELFRLLRTNIHYAMSQDNGKVLLVTSCVDSEGKSYVASNLAMSLALLDKRVALVELDLRNPSLAESFAIPNTKGVSAILNGAEDAVEDLMIPSGRNKNLEILPAGVVPLNPNELLQSERLDTIFAALREQYDFIIVDSAPAAMVSDTFIVNRVCDLTLLVSRVGLTSVEMIEFANYLTEEKRLNKMHCVLNAVKREDLPYGHAYGYAQR